MNRIFKNCTAFKGFEPDMKLLKAFAVYNTPSFLVDLFLKHRVSSTHLTDHVFTHVSIGNNSITFILFDLRDGSIIHLFTQGELRSALYDDYIIAWRNHTIDKLDELI